MALTRTRTRLLCVWLASSRVPHPHHSFMVLPDTFVIHMDHEVTDWSGGDIVAQLWDALAIACDVINASKTAAGLSLGASVH